MKYPLHHPSPDDAFRFRLVLLATAVLAATVAVAAFAALPIAPNSIYSGYATYRDSPKDGLSSFELRTSTTGRRLIVTPGYFQLAKHCNAKWTGTVDVSALPNRHWLTVRDGAFSGAGRTSFQPAADSPTYAARWTVRGKFTGTQHARGTVRVSMRLTQDGRTVLSCPTQTAKWSTTSVRPARGEGSGRG
ncbi:hypothetical protein [Baekduia sp. Peel2402]|uniref:hypothetical protein n=1 Tax=Baekduia sp. Peel2402 TaxID=3458296 RepID=UPI00403EF1A9